MKRRALATIVAAAALAALLVAAGLTVGAYRRDMGDAYARIEPGASRVWTTPQGEAVEYTTGGRGGPPVLVVHGSGGGFDQGAFIAAAVLGEGFRWVAPSRFGYLRSTYRPGATFDDQAHAYAALLDHLRIERVAVVALSHGGPSALLFAALHPDRATSLVLLSAGVASQPSADQRQADRQGAALAWIFQRDWRYWAITHALRGTFLRLMGADADVTAGLDAERRRLVDAIVDGMNPVAPRAAGTVFDHDAAMPNARIAAIRAPTLVVHARDDGLQLFQNAEYAAATIPGARLEAFERGGHLLVATELPRVRALVAEHLRRHATAAAPARID